MLALCKKNNLCFFDTLQTNLDFSRTLQEYIQLDFSNFCYELYFREMEVWVFIFFIQFAYIFIFCCFLFTYFFNFYFFYLFWHFVKSVILTISELQEHKLLLHQQNKYMKTFERNCILKSFERIVIDMLSFEKIAIFRKILACISFEIF